MGSIAAMTSERHPGGIRTIFAKIVFVINFGPVVSDKSAHWVSGRPVSGLIVA